MQRLPSLLFSSLLVCACAAPSSESSKLPGEEPGFTLGELGKADGVLSSADRQRVEAAFDRAIAGAESTIASLEMEIAQLEAELPAKQAEANALVARIASREQELHDSFNNNLLVCAFFPSPACFLASYLANDSALRTYKTELAAAQAEQARIRNNIAEYGTKRDALRARITPLREGKQRLLAMLQGTAPHTAPATLTGDPAAAEAFWRANAMRDVQLAIAGEVSMLLELRALAVEVSNTVDESLRTLRHLEESVNDLVAKQREQFIELLIGFASGDADATAQNFLDEQVASRTRALLKDLRWPMNEFASYLAAERGEGNPVDLSYSLLKKLANTPDPMRYWANTAVAIHDGQATSSGVTLTDARTANEIEIHVRIEHTFIGDLVISMEHAGEAYLLSERVGGSADTVDATFTMTVDNLDVNGTWTLKVADVEASDEGQLVGWELFAY